MTIDPKDAPADQPFKVAVGGRRYTAQRVDPKDDSEQWRLLVPLPSNMSPWKDDEQVSIIAPLVPALNLTRDDLPRPEDVDGWGYRATDPRYPSRLLDAVVAHLNKNGGVPADPKLSVEGVEEARGRMSSVYPGWRHVPVSMPMNPTYGKCCGEAQLIANELARRNEELSEAEEKIAALTKDRKRAETRYRETLERLVEVDGEWNEMRKDRNGQKARAEKAEAERDELQDRVERAEAGQANWELNYWRSQGVCEELQAKLVEAENRPTLDPTEVANALTRFELDKKSFDETLEYILALVPAVEGWPDWLGPRVDPDDFEMRRTEKGRVVGEDGRIFAFEGVTAEVIRDQVHSAVEYAAQLKAAERFIESEQAERIAEATANRESSDSPATGDEEQRVEEQAKALYNLVGPSGMSWDEMSEGRRCDYRAAIRAGWTPPESEDEK